MLVGYSSTLLSAWHRFCREAPLPLQACHFSFARKDASRPRVRHVGLSVKKPIEAKTVGCSLRQNNIVLPNLAKGGRCEGRGEFRYKGSKKRYAEETSYNEKTCMSQVKRKRYNGFPKEGSNCWWFGEQHSVPLLKGLGTYQVPSSVSCLERDQRMCLVTKDVAEPQIPWFDSAVRETTGMGGNNVDSRQTLSKDASSASSESRGLALAPSSNSVYLNDIDIRSTPPSLRGSGRDVVSVQNDEYYIMEHDSIELVSLLVSSVEHIGSKNVPALSRCLARLGELASPRGSTSVHRLIAYYTEALALRVTRLWPNIFATTTPRGFDRVDEESGTAWVLLNEVSPVPKFIQFTSNEILLRAFEGKDRVHIIDFELKEGLQWPSLLQSLASRPMPPSHVRVTGIGQSKLELKETGDRLAEFAGALSLPFEFHSAVDRLEDLRLWMLHVKEGETVAVNCAFQFHKMLYDSTGEALTDFLGLIRNIRAEIVVMAEQEGSHNESNLDARVANSLKYYSAIFDGLDSSLPLDSLVRIKIEEMFAREIRNIIACEGRDRYERHETFRKWKDLMEQGGFCCKGIGEREVFQSEMLLKMYSNGVYRVDKEKGGAAALTLSWLDQPLYTVSSWSAVDIAGSSSSYPQPS